MKASVNAAKKEHKKVLYKALKKTKLFSKAI
jgi:hypothetical protein